CPSSNSRPAFRRAWPGTLNHDERFPTHSGPLRRPESILCQGDMLGRDQQLRTQVYQLLDAILFGLAFWLAHLIRSHWPEDFLWWHWFAIDPFDNIKWLLLIVIPRAPLDLESQGFYSRPFSCPRSTS